MKSMGPRGSRVNGVRGKGYRGVMGKYWGRRSGVKGHKVTGSEVKGPEIRSH